VLDDQTIEYLEEILIGADMGVQTSMELVERVRKNALAEQTVSATRLRKLLSDEVADLLADMPHADPGGGRQRRG
jgi:fused signal recognition particle receptor